MSEPAQITVLIADDHAVVRQSIAAQLEAESDIHVVAQADNADSAVNQSLRLRPRVVLMDVDMPGLSAFSAAQVIHDRLPDTHVVFLSAFTHDSFVENAVKAKACGYVSKSEPIENVLQAVRDVAAGWVYFSADIKSRIVDSPSGPRLAPRVNTKASLLTPREIEILRYLAQGMSAKELAKVMKISPKTVDNHKTSLMAKLDIHNRVDLARFAFREGLATP